MSDPAFFKIYEDESGIESEVESVTESEDESVTESEEENEDESGTESEDESRPYNTRFKMSQAVLLPEPEMDEYMNYYVSNSEDWYGYRQPKPNRVKRCFFDFGWIDENAYYEAGQQQYKIDVAFEKSPDNNDGYCLSDSNVQLRQRLFGNGYNRFLQFVKTPEEMAEYEERTKYEIDEDYPIPIPNMYHRLKVIDVKPIAIDDTGMKYIKLFEARKGEMGESKKPTNPKKISKVEKQPVTSPKSYNTDTVERILPLPKRKTQLSDLIKYAEQHKDALAKRNERIKTTNAKAKRAVGW